MRKWFAALLTLMLALGAFPTVSLGVAKQMRDDVPVWDEDTVKQYALDFIHGNDMERLYSYYDLQVRRYMPMDTYTGMLTEIEWMTGDFVALGTYTSFEEDELKTKTHVLHLCMEAQDLDLYFTHKNKADDWEVMAVEFVPAAKQEAPQQNTDAADDSDTTSGLTYTQTEVQVGSAPYELTGVLTMPTGASAGNRVPAVVLVQGSGPIDRDETIGQTKLFADIADIFAKKGIATLRYDKRTYTYGATMTADEIAGITVEEETIQDAISAGKLLKGNDSVDPTRIVLLGHSMGAMLAPRIASESDGTFTAMILVAGSPKSLPEIMLAQYQDMLDKLQGDALASTSAQADALKAEIAALNAVGSADDARQLTVGGVNGYYYWEMMQYDPIKLMITLKIPTYIVQGNADFQLSPENGVEAYEDALGSKGAFVEYKLFRKLNHLLMSYQGPAENQGTAAEYDTPAHMEKQAGRNLADWVLNLGKTDEEE